MRRTCFIVIFNLLAHSLFSQSAVRNEPRHHNVFENNYIRILDVFIPPHDSSQYHVHSTPSVFTTFTKTATGSQLINGEPVRSVSTPGASWYDSLGTPRIHRVWNEDTSWFHVMDIELIGGHPHSTAPVLQYTSLTLLFSEPLVNGYHVQLKQDTLVELPASGAGYLLLSTGDASVDYRCTDIVQRRQMKAGHYIWIDAGNSCFITSRGNSPSHFLLLQMK